MSHWYDQKGNPRYTVPYANPRKGERPATLRDGRKNNWVPSVTTILQVVAKPGLDRWKREQLLDAAVNIEYSSWSDDESEFKRKVVARASKKAEDAAKRGTELHDAFEHYYLTGDMGEEKDFIEPAIELLNENWSNVKWWPEQSFAHPDGFGGKIDLSAIVSDGWIDECIIVDFKTKTTSDLDKMVAHDEHRMQLAAYTKGMGFSRGHCYNLFISTEKPGIVKLVKHTYEEMQKASEMFDCLVKYWQLSNNYKPEFD